jgi:hypothetical protein
MLGGLAFGPASAAAAPLFAGTSDPGVVYQYQGGTAWTAISPPLGYAVLTLAEFNAQLYAGTISGFPVPDPTATVGQVYRYDGPGTWTLVGNNMDDQVCQLAVYGGNLYAGTAAWYSSGRIYRYDGGTSWTLVVDWTNWDGMRALYVAGDGYLHCGDIHWDKFARFDGTNFYEDLGVASGSCIYDFADYGGALFGSAYVGRLWGSPDGVSWSVVLGPYDGRLGVDGAGRDHRHAGGRQCSSLPRHRRRGRGVLRFLDGRHGHGLPL